LKSLRPLEQESVAFRWDLRSQPQDDPNFDFINEQLCVSLYNQIMQHKLVSLIRYCEMYTNDS
jgi:hypothetical protein